MQLQSRALALLALVACPSAQEWVLQSPLSDARASLASAVVGPLALFAGGDEFSTVSAQVDLFDSNSGLWSQQSLSQARRGLAATSLGQRAFFAGGLLSGVSESSDRVDIYDAASDSWTQATLSEPRQGIGATAVGDFAFFAGGNPFGPFAPPFQSARIDVYDAALDQWSTVELSVPRAHLGATTVGPYALFAGGQNLNFPNNGYQDRVDVYDSSAGPPSDPAAWTTATLSQPRSFAAAISDGTRAYFAGGNLFDGALFQNSDRVDIYDSSVGPPNDPGAWSTATLTEARVFLGTAQLGGQVFFAGGEETYVDFSVPEIVRLEHDVVDVYTIATDSWSVEQLSHARQRLVGASLPERVLFAGGADPWNSGASDPSLDVVDERRQGAWANLGLATEGALGAPSLSGTGSLEGGSSATLLLTEAAPAAPAWLVLGIARIDLPLLGGVLVPAPNAVVAVLQTDGAGSAQSALPVPLSSAAGLPTYWQAWVLDAGGPAGFAASNGLLGVLP